MSKQGKVPKGKNASRKAPIAHGTSQHQPIERQPIAGSAETAGQGSEPPGSALNRRLLDSIPSPTLVVTPNLEVVFANAASSKTLGLGSQSLQGKHLADVLRLEGVGPLVTSALKTTRPHVEREVIFTHPRKGPRWLRISATRLNESWPYPSGMTESLLLLSMDDVTTQRQAQEGVRENNRLIALGELVAGVAHELNNPLTSVMGFAQLLLQREVGEEDREALEIILGETQREAKVVRNLLSFARKYQAEKTLVDIPSIVQRVLALKAYDLRVANVGVQTNFSPALPKVYADEHQLEEVFLNIVNNAQQAMVETKQQCHLAIVGTMERQAVRISFFDSGPGIPPQHLKAIFKPFFTTKAPGKGTGLGLSISKSLVQQQGGRIWAESEPGKGAVFHVEIPARQE